MGTENQTGRRHPIRAVLGFLSAMAWGFVLLLLTLWAGAALYFDVPSTLWRIPFAVVYVFTVLAAWIFLKSRWLAAGWILFGFVLVLTWWLGLTPANLRNWQPDVAVLAHAVQEGNRITVHNIRNCDYHTDTEFLVRYYDKTVELDKLRTADLYMVYWGSPHMAHTMVSFGFEDGSYLCFSIETRKEQGESYSAIRGLFRQFELVYVVADERDVVRLRTNYRKGEDAYLYRLKGSPEQVRTLFLDYLRRLNSLYQHPEWYNAVTHNCTTSIRMQRATSHRLPWDWRILANGYGDEMLYEQGIFDTDVPFQELKKRAHINERARATTSEADFSRSIRQNIPGIDL